jgi:electron transport complex protein RnfG
MILESIAHDGYAGDIKLLVGIHMNGVISGVRVLTHKETPGLGDYIDFARDTWISIFDGQSLKKTVSEQWKVQKDGGQFDYMVGATISPRAVVKKVHETLQFFNTEKKALLAAQKEQKKTALAEVPEGTIEESIEINIEHDKPKEKAKKVSK